MIDPKNITNFNRTEAELQEFLLFCICVAGKNSHQQAKKLSEFLRLIMEDTGEVTPFAALQKLGREAIRSSLEQVKMGQYERITKAFYSCCFWEHLGTRDVNDFMCIKGIGPKTARFFVMHSRPNQQIAVLDTHILKWLAHMGHTVPKQTPSGKKYLVLEGYFLNLCKLFRRTPAELDLEIWASRAKGSFPFSA